MIIAATNHPEILDRALFRRFDDVIRFEVPTRDLLIRLLQERLAGFKTEDVDWEVLAHEASGLSHGDLVRACEDAAKDMVIEGKKAVQADRLLKAVQARKSHVPA
jgi:SpoVK/Ycf46/Vps4 family AAA+-type ATPase